MIEATRTRTGVVIERTDTIHGCLQQGGLCGRRELYTVQQVEAAGLDAEDIDIDRDWHQIARMLERVEPARVLRRGTRIV